MKKTLLFVLLLLCTTFIFAQIDVWLWAKKAGGTQDDEGYSIDIDSSGNSYVTGYFYGTASFGSTTLTSGGSNDIFVAKLDSSGNWLWAKKAGGTGSDYSCSIATDSSGNSFVTGYFYGTASFGSITLTSSGSADIFVAKLDSSGNWLGVQKAGGTSGDMGYSIATDSSGNSYVTGAFAGTASFGDINLTSSESYDIFVARLDSGGNWLWAQRAGGTSADYGFSIATDPSGNSYVTGYFQGTASFGDTNLTSSGSADIFVAKLDSNGNWLWAKQAGGIYDDEGRGIAIDSYGNSYVTGAFARTVSFGTTTLTSSGYVDIFVAKLDSDGNWLWAKQAGGTGFDFGYGIATKSSGYSHVTGKFQGTASFGSTTLTSSGNADIFVAKLDNSGNWLGAQKAGGTGIDDGQSIAIDSYGNSYVTGYFQRTASFGDINISSSGLYDIFVAKAHIP
ncbi:MAG: SBBP repeat-containing protein [Candidatus Cloacimonetes bacterium]|nr:SBBP repeat-containing protein [Candidatus Cloacimonadota bacterium]